MAILFLSKAKICNPTDPRRCQALEHVLVDNGSFYSFIPAKILKHLGIKVSGREKLILANGKKIIRRIGTASCEVFGKRRGCEVIFVGKNDSIHLGAHALEALGLEIDQRNKKILLRESSLAV